MTHFLGELLSRRDDIDFSEVISYIDETYHFMPVAFVNGGLFNPVGSNVGSCKILTFSLLNKLDCDTTLSLFGTYYRHDVLGHPGGSDHGNIRNFMRYGWPGVNFFGESLRLREGAL